MLTPHQQCIGFLAVSTLAALATVIILPTKVWNDEKTAFEGEYSLAVFNVTLSEQNPYRCSQKRGCQCTEAPASAQTCNHMTANLISGSCNDGYHCCQTECDTCYHTCYDTCYNTCTRTKYRTICNRRLRSNNLELNDTETESHTKSSIDHRKLSSSRTNTRSSTRSNSNTNTNSGSSCREVADGTETYNCNPYDCRPHNCRPYDCNCRCVNDVTRQKCTNYVSNCYNPYYVLSYSPVEAKYSDEYLDCYSDQLGLEYSRKEAQENCKEHLLINIRREERFGIDDSAGANRFLEGHHVGNQFNGLYNKNNFQDIELDGELDFEPSGGLITGIVLSSIWLFASLVGLVYVISIYKGENVNP